MPIISPKIPQGLEELMKGLAKSVIKENPDNIYEFAAEYFENLLRERDGTDDQNYKKFATYKVYKKSKMERRKREREIISSFDTEKGQLQHERILSLDDKVSSDQNDDDNSIEKISSPPMKVSQDIMVSTESEINTTIQQDSFVEDEGSPQKSVNSEDEDIKGLVLDDEMANAALKIQSTFRGHKVRKEMKETQQNENEEDQKPSDSLIESENFGDEVTSSKEENDENNQINDTETDEIMKKSDEDGCETGNNVEEKDEINLENHSTAANENEFNDDEIAHDGKLSIENVDTTSEVEELLNFAENNVEENLQPENVILMEADCNAEEIITNESTQSFDNVEINLDEDDNKNVDSSQDVQEDLFESENVQTLTDDQDPEKNDNVNLENVDDMILDDEMEEAALKIQSAFRGHQVRKDMNQKDVITSSTDNVTEENCEEKEILADSENVIGEIMSEEQQENENKISEELVSTLELSQEEIINGNDDINNNDDEEKLSKDEAIMESELLPEENVNEEEVETTELNSNQVEEESAIEMSNEQVDNAVVDEKSETEISIEACENEQTVEQSESKADEQEMSQDILEDNKQDDAAVDEPEETQTIGDILENNEGEILMPDDAELEQVSDENIVEQASQENEVDNLDENNEEQQQDEIIDGDKASPTDIDYEVLCESTDSLEKIETIETAEVVDVASPTNIDYEELCESIESPEKLESKATTNENSIDADSKSIDSKTSFGNELEDQQEQIKPENILCDFISPYDLYDEVVNTEATFMAEEMDQNENEVLADENDELEEAAVKIQSAFRGHKTRMEIKFQHETVKESTENESAQNTEQEEDDIKNMVLDDEMEQAALKIQSSFRGHKVRKHQRNDVEKKDEDNIYTDEPVEISMDDKSQEQIEKITNPELLDLSEKEEPMNDNDEIRDEILTPDKEESEIPEENNVPYDDISYPEQENCNADEAIEPNLSTENGEENDSKKLSNDEESNEIDNMILDEEMEDAALKIQAVFRGHQVRKTTNATNDSELSKQDESTNNETIVIEQCSEGNEDTQDNDENEQQDTSADVDEIQECEAAEQENETEETEQTNETEEVNENEEETTETNEQGGDDPDEPEQAEGESSEQQQNNDDDDIANMVLDEEMEQAALKIQSTFRGHKARSEVKPKQEEDKEASKEDSVQNIDDEIANMVLDDEMEQAALKIQSAFRGNKSKKEETTTEESKDDEDEKKEEEKPEEDKNEASSSGGSSEKTAKQLQDEEDIANIVMDDEMEKTALKIQSAFRGKIKRKSPKDGLESYESSADDYNADAEESLQKSDENVGDMYEFFSVSVECDDEDDDRGNSYDDDDYNDYLAKRESYANDGGYSIDRYNNGMDAYNETIYPSDYDNDVDLMHGGGIFPETSGESATLESFAEYLSEDNNNNNDPPEDKREFSNRMSESTLQDENKEELIEQKSEEKVIETYDFNSNKDTAEALYYSLKKNEIEAQKRFESVDTSQDMNDFQCEMNEKNDNESLEKEEEECCDISMEDDDDDDVVVKSPSNDVQKLKYGMSMDDRLLGSILSQDYTKGRKMYPDESFDPLLEEAMSSNYSVLEKMNEYSKSGDDRKIDDNNVGDEDQFDDFFPGNIRSKIMASSISIADSDYFDPTNNKSIIDDDRIRTALETIHSTDSESTIGSAATKIQAGDKNFMSHRKTFQYSSIGNAAIDKSLDEFILSQELKIADRFEEEPEGYNSPPPKKQESADDFTDDTCTESEKRPTMAGIIEIKLEQKNFLTIDERRRTLHREDAIQRNSTRSVDEDLSKSVNASHEKNQIQTESTTITTSVQGQNSVIDTEIAVPVLEKPKTNVNMKPVKVPMRRQKTMPVQIESNVIRVLPKHLRKRIKSADSDKKKRIQKQ